MLCAICRQPIALTVQPPAALNTVHFDCWFRMAFTDPPPPVAPLPVADHTAPTHCPFCGQPVTVVRWIVSNMFEMACQPCDRTAIVLADDHEKF